MVSTNGPSLRNVCTEMKYTILFKGEMNVKASRLWAPVRVIVRSRVFVTKHIPVPKQNVIFHVHVEWHGFTLRLVSFKCNTSCGRNLRGKQHP